MKIKIHITKEVLEKTKMCSSDEEIYTNCAISFAVRNFFPKAFVCCGSINPYGHGISHIDENTIPLPQKANYFIRDFDQSSPEQRVSMCPFSFDIEVPKSVIKKIGIDQVHAILKESKTLSLA